MNSLALLGDPPAFPEGLAFARPPLPPLERVVARLAPSYDRGILTNGPLVRSLEDAVADRLRVGHVVAVASCTAGLMLALHAVTAGDRPAPLDGPRGTVVLPSFTFSASAHAVTWNGGRARFVECDRETFQADLVDAATQLDGVDALLVTHLYGAPCAPAAVERLAVERGLPVVFDAAHALGATHGGRPIGGFGDAEVFSLSPTKPVVAGEGGLVATDRADVADVVRLGRDYGNPGDYDTRFAGLNARMSELHAALALESLAELDGHLEMRNALAARYQAQLADVPGVRFQRLAPGDTSTWKDCTIAVDEGEFGVSRDGLVSALRADGIDTRCYFDPPAHRQRSHAAEADRRLPVTDQVASEVVSLPLYRDVTFADVDRIAGVLRAVRTRRSALLVAGVH